mmetsp:Transcript_43340/g.108302  ORF Transcript_43340/g.108302 Transcript_43340/m.108302 type:complete len:203 (+) Transcript_43340:264-872(+)
MSTRTKAPTHSRVHVKCKQKLQEMFAFSLTAPTPHASQCSHRCTQTPRTREREGKRTATRRGPYRCAHLQPHLSIQSSRPRMCVCMSRFHQLTPRFAPYKDVRKSDLHDTHTHTQRGRTDIEFIPNSKQAQGGKNLDFLPTCPFRPQSASRQQTNVRVADRTYRMAGRPFVSPSCMGPCIHVGQQHCMCTAPSTHINTSTLT